LLTAATTLSAQPSPKQTATATIGGKAVTIKYSAPSVKGRKIFGDGGLVSKDPGAPVWRAGANEATALHLDGDSVIGGLAVPAGDYTLYANVKDPDNWELVVNKKTGQWGIPYKEGTDLGRVKMKMATPPALIETLKYTVTDSGGGKGQIQLEWENHIASVSVTVK
jgi:Protein of unknown function (DUF2911)